MTVNKFYSQNLKLIELLPAASLTSVIAANSNKNQHISMLNFIDIGAAA